MHLTAEEEAMLAGEAGRARQRAMELLVAYGDALGAERLVETNNVCGANVLAAPRLGGVRLEFPSQDALFSELSLDSPVALDVPPVLAHSCQLIGRMDARHWQLQGIPAAIHDELLESEEYNARHGVQLMTTCAPYLAGNVPVRGEHCAWMESSAVIYINSVLGARSNVEGRESTAAAMLTGRIPYWGYHLDSGRRGTHRVAVEWDVGSSMDWGLLGYYIGERVGSGVPVLDGVRSLPDLPRLKHFGAAAATSGGVEMYHIPGVTAEARSVEEAFGGTAPAAVLRFGAAERRWAYEALNATGRDRHVDFVMTGCPHADLGQIGDICRWLGGRHVHPDCQFWVFTPHALRAAAERSGYARILADAGAVLMSDTCPAMGQFVPAGTRVVATDSAKQGHYLPAIMKLQSWFGSTEDCVDAAVTGRWGGGLS